MTVSQRKESEVKEKLEYIVFEDTVECFAECPETKCMIYLKCNSLETAGWDRKVIG